MSSLGLELLANEFNYYNTVLCKLNAMYFKMKIKSLRKKTCT